MFYVLKRTIYSTQWSSVGREKKGLAPQCPKCGRYIGSIPTLPPYRIELEVYEAGLTDIAFGTGSQIAISENLKKIYEESKFTGFKELHAAEVKKIKYYKNSNKRSTDKKIKYFIAKTCYSRAVIDDKASGFIRQKPRNCEECRNGGLIRKGDRIVFEANSWTGEDIFIPRGLPQRIIISDRFHSAIVKADLNIEKLVKAEEYHFDHHFP